jgi:5-methylcytosine-specific restriction endonuclease McrA
MSDMRRWGEIVTKVNAIVRTMPMRFLQNVDEDSPAFLYGMPGRGKPIRLKPGVAYCLRKYQELVADLVRGSWALRVRRFNGKLLDVTADLQEFLFGSERTDLLVVVAILRPLQNGKCFYCPRELRGDTVHVDHFIPWLRYPVDLGHDLVLAHGGCNAKKSDWLASEEHLAAWVAHSERNAARL